MDPPPNQATMSSQGAEGVSHRPASIRMGAYSQIAQK